MDITKLLSLGTGASLFLVVMGTGLASQRGEASHVLRQPALYGRSLLSMQVLAPLLAVAIAMRVPLAPGVKIALVTLSIAPVPPFLPRKIMRAGGSRPYIISLLATSAILSIISIPITLSFLSDVFGMPLSLPHMLLARRLILSILLPLLAGIVVSRVAPSVASEWAQPITSGGTLALVLCALPLVASHLPAFRTLIGDGTLVVMGSYALATLFIGHLLGGPDRENRTALALATTSRHPGVALLIAQINFADEATVAPAVVLMVLVSVFVSAPYVALTRRRAVAPLRAAPHH